MVLFHSGTMHATELVDAYPTSLADARIVLVAFVVPCVVAGRAEYQLLGPGPWDVDLQVGDGADACVDHECVERRSSTLVRRDVDGDG